MALTGKTLEQFNEWYWSEWLGDKERAYHVLKSDAIISLYTTDELFLNALIIEWFDSIGIIINVSLDEVNSKKYRYLVTDTNIMHLHCWMEGVNKETRKEATEEAIKKANEILNARLSQNQE